MGVRFFANSEKCPKDLKKKLRMMKEKSQDLIFDFTDLYKDFADNQEFKKDVLGMMFDIVMKKQRMQSRAGRF